MQIWSIIFRSWLSIIFLLVVSILWTRPFEQKSTHRVNLFIVFYADFLLILQYFYCMILTADELPFRDSAILSNLAQIGVVRYDSFPCIPLLFKAICTITFCFTLRQKQQLDQNRASILTANSIQIDPEQGIILKCFHFGVNVFTHIWVTMILLTMFIYAIYGSEVNLLKFCYMVYVLVFLISYQLSLNIWRKMMYALWTLVIFSSMVSLILIYTYQFEGFDYFWEDYLRVNKHMWVVLYHKEFILSKINDSIEKKIIWKISWLQAKYYRTWSAWNKASAHSSILFYIFGCNHGHSTLDFSQEIQQTVPMEGDEKTKQYSKEKLSGWTKHLGRWSNQLWNSKQYFNILYSNIQVQLVEIWLY